MEWNMLYSNVTPPTWEQVIEYIDSPLWADFNERIRSAYQVKPCMEHSRCSMQAGWNVKYKKSGKSLCTLYPMEGYFIALVVVGSHELTEAEFLMPLCSEYVQTVFNSTKSGNGQKWLMLDVRDGETAEDVFSVVSLALCRQGEIVMGIVYDPFHEEVFSAVKGKGSFLNGQPIHVSSAEKLSDTMIGLGTAKRELADENFARFRRVFGQCQDVRRLGSAVLELAYTACGRQGGYFEIYLNPWDYAAGMLLIQEAGGQVTDFAGKLLDPRKGGSVVATNGGIHNELLRLL